LSLPTLPTTVGLAGFVVIVVVACRGRKGGREKGVRWCKRWKGAVEIIKRSKGGGGGGVGFQMPLLQQL